VLPLYARGSLADALRAAGGGAAVVSMSPHRARGLPAATALRLAGQVACALAAMHALSPPLAHRDVCPRNVLVDDGGDAVLADFGSAVAARVPLRTRTDALRLAELAAQASSAPYRAPELWDPPHGADAAVTPSAVVAAAGGGAAGSDGEAGDATTAAAAEAAAAAAGAACLGAVMAARARAAAISAGAPARAAWK
jgi:hypothetical protein